MKLKFPKLDKEIVLTGLAAVFAIVVFTKGLDFLYFVNASFPCQDEPEICSLDESAPEVAFTTSESVSETEKLIRFSASDAESGIWDARIRIELQSDPSIFEETSSNINPIVGTYEEDYMELEYEANLQTVYNMLGEEEGTYDFFAIVQNGNGLESEPVFLESHSYDFEDPNQLSVSLQNTKISYSEPIFEFAVDSITDECTQPITQLYIEFKGNSASKDYPSFDDRCEMQDDLSLEITDEPIGTNKIVNVRLTDDSGTYWPGPSINDFYQVSFDLGHPMYIQMMNEYPTDVTQEIRFNVINESGEYYEDGDEREPFSFNVEIPGYSPSNNVDTRDGYYYLDISDLNLDQNQQYQFKVTVQDDAGTYYPRVGEFFTSNFDFGNFPAEVTDLNASDNQDFQIEITYTVPDDTLNMMRLQRIEGACSESNYPNGHEEGVTVQELVDPIANDPASYVDTDVSVSQSYCYAVFTMKNDIWNDVINPLSSGNHDTGFVGGDHDGPAIDFIEIPTILNKAVTNEVDIVFDAIDEVSTIVSAEYIADYSNPDMEVNDDLLPEDESFDETVETFIFSVGADAEIGSTITVSFEVEDSAGNVTVLTDDLVINVTYDENPPETILDTYEPDPTSDVRPIISGSAWDPDEAILQSIQYRINNGEVLDWTDVTITDGSLDEFEENFTIEPDFDLPDGNMVFEVRTIDQFGNQAQEGNYARELITIQARDNTAPVINIFELPDIVYEPNPKIHVEVLDDTFDLTSNIALVEYSLNNTDWTELETLDGSYDEDKEEFDVLLNDLEVGDYTLYVRASDVSNNSTFPDSSYTIEFSIVEQDADLEAQIITIDEDFNDNSKSARELTTAIWGNGIARLSVNNTVSRTTKSNSYLAPRYTTYSGDAIVERSSNGGFWINIEPTGETHQFAFVSDSNVTTMYDVFALHGIEVQNQGNPDIKTAIRNGREHIVVLTGVGFIIIDTNNTPANPNDDIAANYVDFGIFSGQSSFKFAETIETGDNNFGVLIFNDFPNDRIVYVEPVGDLSDVSDDLYHEIANPSVVTEGIVRIKKQPGTNNIWINKDAALGTARWNYGADIENEGDDSVKVYDVEFSRDTTWDSQGNAIIGTSTSGVVVVNDDDSVTTIASRVKLGDFATNRVYFLEGEYPVGDQILAVAVGSGFVYHIYPNNTYSNIFDDQIIQYDPTLGEYPADEPHLYVDPSNDRFYANLPRYGFFSYDINRDYESKNTAISLTSANQHLYSNFIRLEAADVTAFNYSPDKKEDSIFAKLKNLIFPKAEAQGIPSNITIQVTNNGVDWFDIDVGQLVEFPTSDYRVRFRILLDKVVVGETPVVDDILLTYAAYKDESSIEATDFDVTFSKSQVSKGEAFNMTINAVDILGFPVTDVNGTLEIAARKVGDVTNNNYLSIASANMVNGVANINGATFSQATENATYQLFVKLGSLEGTSDTGIIVAGTINNTNNSGNASGGVNNPAPTLTFTADKYKVAGGEAVKFTWSSTNLTQVQLDGKTVDLNGELTVVVDKTTIFQLTGTGPYGNLTAELTVIVDGSDGALEVTVDKNEITLGEKVKLNWSAGDAEYVTISGFDQRFSPIGSTDIIPDREGLIDYVVTAHFADGTSTNKTLTVNVLGVELVASNLDERNSIGSLALGIFLVSGGTLGAMTILDRSYRYGVIGILIPKKKKYWGIVFDELESKPIPFAIVRVFKDVNKELVNQTVTDMDGKYGVLLDVAGKYIVEARASGYKEKTKNISLSDLSNDLEIVEDIGLYKLDEKLNIIQRILSYKRIELYENFRKLLLALAIIGLIYTLYATFDSPILANFALLIFYGLIFGVEIYNFFRREAKGKVIDVDTANGIAGVTVRVFNDKAQLSLTLSNLIGELKLKLGEGKYKATAYKEGYKIETFTDSQFLDIEIDKNGYITTDIAMRKDKDIDNKDGFTLANPFA